MRLAIFILANVETILAEWEVFARSIWPDALDSSTTDRPRCGITPKLSCELRQWK